MALGETLRQKRLEHGWTKEYVSERTHFMVRTIDALENETYGKIPAPIYGRGFIKQYCALLGIDAEPLLDEYMRAVSREPAHRAAPLRSVAPVHTGGRRTMPPVGPIPTPTPDAPHRFVEAGIASASEPEQKKAAPASEPKPEKLPAAPASASQETPILPAEPEPLVLDGGDGVPPPRTPKPPKTDTPPPPKTPRTHVAPPARPKRAPTGKIFSPYEPEPEPIHPHLGALLDILAQIKQGLAALFRYLFFPKIRRMNDANTPFFLFRRVVIVRMVCMVAACAALVGLAFAFRYVFRASAEAETENIAATAIDQPFTPRLVAPPPEPYFK